MAPISMDRNSSARTGTRAFPVAATIVLSAAGLAALAGCSAPRSWPSAGDPSPVSADVPPMPQLVSSALKYAHDEIAPSSPLVYNLPSEMNPPAFAAFERALAPGKAMCPGDTHVWTVRQVRIDGGKAQVDVEFPSRDGFYQTVTVHMAGAAAGIEYKPAYLQYWKVPVKDPVCQQPVEVVERLCGADAAAKLRTQREMQAPAAAPAKPQGTAAAGGAEEPSK